MIRTAVIGMGNMGSRYASILHSGTVSGLELSAVTRIKETYRDRLNTSIERDIPVYESAEKLACENEFEDRLHRKTMR